MESTVADSDDVCQVEVRSVIIIRERSRSPGRMDMCDVREVTDGLFVDQVYNLTVACIMIWQEAETITHRQTKVGTILEIVTFTVQIEQYIQLQNVMLVPHHLDTFTRLVYDQFFMLFNFDVGNFFFSFCTCLQIYRQ